MRAGKSWPNGAIRATLVLSPTAVFVIGVWWPGYLLEVTTLDGALAASFATLGLVVVPFAAGAWNWGTQGASESS